MNRQILRLAVPNIINNLTVPLLSSVDTALVGHLEGVYFLGAIAVGGMIFNMVYWGFGFLRMGTTGLTAQAFGQKDESASFLVLLRALLVAGVSAICLFCLQKPIADLSFILVKTSPDVENFARTYFFIRIYAAPATLGMYAFSGWFLGMQNARYPLYLAFVTNVLNILFNLLFLKVFGMNVDGVALGTVLANYLGLLTAIVLFYKRYRGAPANFRYKRVFDLSELKRFFALNRDIFIRTLVLLFAFSFFTAKSAESGELILAANSILINLWTIMSYGIDGFAFAAESLVGKFVGARNRADLVRTVRLSFFWGLGLGFIFLMIYGLFPRWILGLFTDKEDVISLAMQFMIWTIIAPVLSSFCYIWDGIFIGATASKAMRNAMLISLFVFYLPPYYILFDSLQNTALWLSLCLFMLARGVTLTFHYRREILSQV